MKIRLNANSFVRTVVTIAVCSIFTFYFLNTPMSGYFKSLGVIGEAMVFGALAYFIMGALCRLWTRGLVSLGVGIAVGIILGGAAVEHRLSDISISYIRAAWHFVSVFWILNIAWLAIAVVSWLLANTIVNWRRERNTPES
jgi:ABC-type antimicrobial peptide transport system permease subunit